MMKLFLNGVEAKAIKAELSGRADSPARRLDIQAAEWLSAGDTAELYYGGKRYFLGKVIYADNSKRDGVCTAWAMDNGIYLVRNRLYMSYTGSPQEIGRRVCAQLGIKSYSLASLSGKVKILSTGNMSAYDILRKAYPAQRIYFEGGTLRTANPVLRGEVGDVIEQRRVQSARDMINRVLILKRKRLHGTVENEGDIMRFGVFTGTYTQPLSGESVPKSALRGMSDEIEVTAAGNIELAAGDMAAFLGHSYTVAEDRHIFGGDYVCRLSLKV